MSLKVPFYREFLEHLDLTLTGKIFQVSSLDYYLPIEQHKRPKTPKPQNPMKLNSIFSKKSNFLFISSKEASLNLGDPFSLTVFLGKSLLTLEPL